MNPIIAIIATLLDAHRDAGTHSNPELAETLANALTVASWEQLAAVTGASLETDYSGQVVLYTGCYKAQADQKIIYAREPTEEDESPAPGDVQGLRDAFASAASLRAEDNDDGWAEPF